MNESTPFNHADEVDEVTNGHLPSMEEYLSYRPPAVPVGDPALWRWVYESVVALPDPVKLFWITICNFADSQHQLCLSKKRMAEICTLGSKNTVERYLRMGEEVNLVRKIAERIAGDHPRPAKYLLLARERDYKPLRAGKPNTPQYLAESYAMRHIEQQEMEIQFLRGLLADRGEEAIAHSHVTNGEVDNDYSELTMMTLEDEAAIDGLPPKVIERLSLEIIDGLKTPGMPKWTKNPSFGVNEYLRNPGKYRVAIAAAQAQAAKQESEPDGQPEGAYANCADCGELYARAESDAGYCGGEVCQNESRR